MWQYGKGEVPGIYGATDFNVIEIGGNADYPASSTTKGVDLDYAYEDFPTEIISNGLNNYPAPVNKEENWKNDPCRNVSDTLDIKGVTPILSGDTWFLIDKSCSFTLETLPYAKVNVYLVGGGEDGAEWVKQEKNGRIFYKAANKSRGGCVLQKQIYITGNVECKAFIAKANEPLGTSLKIGNDIYKCNDEGYIWRKAAASAGTGIFCNAESGANGLKTPYGYVGSSGGGGGTYNQGIEAFAGKGGAGAGDGGAVKQDGLDAVNYGCGGGAAGFGGFPSAENTVETHGGHGMGGCIIFEILDGGACDGSSNKPTAENNSGGCFCECPHHEFTCPEPAETSSSCERETNYTLTYDGDTPVETENTTSNSSGGDGGTSADNSEITNNTSNSASGCGSSNSNHGSSCGNSSGNCKSGCGCGTGNSKCFSYNVQKWGENWLLFDKSGDYSLTMDSDVVFTAYLAGGGSDGENGIYYNKTAYGGNGGSGGSVAIIRDIKVSAGELDITVMIGSAGDSNGTSVIINNNEYTCNDSGCETNDGGFQGISGKHGHKNAGNGSNGIETPFGYIGSSGGGGAAYCNNSNSGYGKGGLNAGNGGKIVNGKSTPGDKATGYGCGGGGGAASSVSWCKGGKGKQGCVILTWE